MKLTVTTPSDTEVVMTREFNAPRNLVWRAMTEPDLLRKWMFAPPGWTMTQCDEDLRVGGKYRWAWNGPDGQEIMSMHGIYRDVSSPSSVTRTEEFVMGGNSLGEQIATLALSEKGGKTLVTITLSYASKQARDGALASGMEGGMNAGYDRLDEMLTSNAVA